MKAFVIFALALAALSANVSFGDDAPVRKTGDTRTIVLPGGAEMEMIWCGPGTFKMGSEESERGRFDDEDVHEVVIRKGFWLGKYEVTQDQWRSVMLDNRAKFLGHDKPEDSVSWHDCQRFIERVNAAIGGGARLPTEAEWEYACRAGSEGAMSGGADIDDVAWFAGNSFGQSEQVGQKAPNAWGFYDMHGNLLEWCYDWYSKLGTDKAVDPRGPIHGSFRVLKGGCWFFYARDCRCAYRLKRDPETRNCLYGFRLALTERPVRK